jgi:hypothetical protein
MDPIGLSLEDFDGAGVYRTTESGQTIDVSGEVVSSDVTGAYMGAPGLAQKLSESQMVKDCVSGVWFQYAYGRESAMPDACTVNDLNQKFSANGYKFKDLLVALTQTDAFLYRNSIPAGGDQ